MVLSIYDLFGRHVAKTPHGYSGLIAITVIWVDYTPSKLGFVHWGRAHFMILCLGNENSELLPLSVVLDTFISSI